MKTSTKRTLKSRASPTLIRAIDQLKGFPLLYPLLPEQVAIASLLTDMDVEIDALEKRLAKTRALKEGMMQELLTAGHVDYFHARP